MLDKFHSFYLLKTFAESTTRLTKLTLNEQTKRKTKNTDYCFCQYVPIQRLLT